MSITYDRKTPHRFDVVGSYLRPEYLKEARKNYKAGKISEEELHKVEDRCWSPAYNNRLAICR